MEFHSLFGIKYADFRKTRFVNELENPQQVLVKDDNDFNKKKQGKLGELLSKKFDNYYVHYFFSVKEQSLYERISVSHYTFELHTSLNDDDIDKVIKSIFILYGVKQHGKIPKEFDDHMNADNFIHTLLASEDKKRKKVLMFDFQNRKVYLKKNPEISLRLRLERNGFYYICDNRGTYKEEREMLAENIHKFIQKQKVRMIVGIK